MPCAGTIGGMDHSFLSAFVLLLLVFDPFGSLPIFISVLLIFMLGGQSFLGLMRLLERSLAPAAIQCDGSYAAISRKRF